jgi:hypothetical protein
MDSVAESGKAAYDIPMFINAVPGRIMQSGRGFSPVPPDEIFGMGGPVSKVLDIYKWFTPHVDIIGPDIYIRNSGAFEAVCTAYSRNDNPLFLPESGSDSNMFHAIADYNSIGYFFYGAESIFNKDGSVSSEAQTIVDSFRCVAEAIPLLLKYQGTGKIHAVTQDGLTQEEFMGAYGGLDFDGYLGQVQFGGWQAVGEPPLYFDWRHLSGYFSSAYRGLKEQGDSRRGGGLIIQANRNEFYLVGANYRLFLRPKLEPEKMSPFLFREPMFSTPGRQTEVDEGHFDQNGAFVVDRQRNPDPVGHGLWVEPDVGVVRVLMCD